VWTRERERPIGDGRLPALARRIRPLDESPSELPTLRRQTSEAATDGWGGDERLTRRRTAGAARRHCFGTVAEPMPASVIRTPARLPIFRRRPTSDEGGVLTDCTRKPATSRSITEPALPQSYAHPSKCGRTGVQVDVSPGAVVSTFPLYGVRTSSQCKTSRYDLSHLPRSGMWPTRLSTVHGTNASVESSGFSAPRLLRIPHMEYQAEVSF
jgi:hypothetical protein